MIEINEFIGCKSHDYNCILYNINIMIVITSAIDKFMIHVEINQYTLIKRNCFHIKKYRECLVYF